MPELSENERRIVDAVRTLNRPAMVKEIAKHLDATGFHLHEMAVRRYVDVLEARGLLVMEQRRPGPGEMGGIRRVYSVGGPVVRTASFRG